MKTHLHYFYQWEAEKPSAPFLKQPEGDNWHTWTYGEAGQEIRKMAAALKKLNLPRQSHIGIFAKNCRHWVVADLAIAIAGHVCVPFYASLEANEIAQVLKLGNIDALFVGRLENWASKKDGIPADMPVIRFPNYKDHDTIDLGQSWAEMVADVEAVEGQPSPNLEDIWTIMFTSGTTGTPKGVVHSFRNLAELIKVDSETNCFGTQDMQGGSHLSYLPLNHTADRSTTVGLVVAFGGCVWFVESLNTFAKNLQDAQPSVFVGVPRIWHKFQTAVLEKMPQKKLDRLLKIPIIKNVVKKGIRQKLGLNQVVRCYTSTAITPDPIKEWFAKLDVSILECYGMTETIGPFTIMPTDDIRSGTVGKPVKTAQLKIDPDTGEILKKAPWLIDRYYNNEELTNKVIVDGWLHTGDKGVVDEEGFLKIVGRIKDTFKTAKGEFITPATLEQFFDEDLYIDQICVMGLGLPQPIALLTLSELANDVPKKELHKHFMGQLEQINKAVKKYERISHLVVIPGSWTFENGFLTQTLKLKRAVMREHYSNLFNDWSENKEDKVIWHAA